MPYWDRPTSSSPSLDSTSVHGAASRKQTPADAFYEIEPAIVLDIILDKNHPYFQNTKLKLQPTQWPVGIEKKAALTTDLDYTWIGRALVRLVNSQRNIEKEDLVWALPLEANISEYPVLNEVVGVVFYLGQYFYTRKINSFNTPNANADFNLELIYGGFRENVNAKVQGNREYLFNPQAKKEAFKGPLSNLGPQPTFGYNGVMGRYFLYNNRIRTIKRREGDLVIESRFGQSIRFGAYDDNRANDKGYSSTFNGYDDYKGNGTKYVGLNQQTYEQGGGNPMILIRNRQRPLAIENKEIKCYDNLPVVRGTSEEKNVGGYIMEDINNDGTSIHITSGVTVSGFKTNCYKKLWGLGEEQSSFNGGTSFVYPTLLGDQIVVNSDRVIISAKKNEMFQYAKKRMAFVTDDEFTVDANNQIVINTNNKTVINSPAIYLGQYDQTNEPALLGQTTVNWLYDLCQWLLAHTHWYMHTHPDAQGGTTGNSQENKTQTTVQAAQLIVLREQLNLLMSRRVFLVGGGLANGVNGVGMKNAAGASVGSAPTTITIPSGAGVPGGFSGMNRKYTATDPAPPGAGTDKVFVPPTIAEPTVATPLSPETSTTTDIAEESADVVEEAIEDSAAVAAALKEMKALVKQDPKNKALVENYKYSQKEAKEARKQTAAAKNANKNAQKWLKKAEKSNNQYEQNEFKAKAIEQADKAKYASQQADESAKHVTGTLEIMKKQVAESPTAKK